MLYQNKMVMIFAYYLCERTFIPFSVKAGG